MSTTLFGLPREATSTTAPPSLATVRDWPLATKLHWVLRIGLMLCFLGHGGFGVIGKVGWLPYYDVFGIPHSLASDTMPVIGALDIAIGIVTLIRPMRAVLVYAIFWTAFTAFLRPLAGQGLWQEVVERGGNYGLPLALLVLVGLGGRDLRSWFELAQPREVTADLAKVLSWTLRICIALLLIGHGGFGITGMHVKEWTGYFGFLGMGSGTVASSQLPALVGWFEVCLGLAVLIRPLRGLILFILAWKFGTELLRLLVGEPVGELVERSGDFFLPAALFLVQGVLARGDVPRPSSFAPPPRPAFTPARVPVAAGSFRSWPAPDPAPLGGLGGLNGLDGRNGHPTPAPRELVVTRTSREDPELVRAAAAIRARLATPRRL